MCLATGLEGLVMVISEKKVEMIKIGMEKGLLSEETIKCSQELDKLLNEYNGYLLESRRSKRSNEYVESWFYLLERINKFLLFPYNYFLFIKL
jgi:hypothetical protein